MNLELYVADESIESPSLSDTFLTELLWEQYFTLEDFLTSKEAFIARPNPYGEIVFGKKRESTFLEKAKISYILNKAMKGKITVDEINKLRDKFMDRSEKVEDRERNPLELKRVLEKVEKHIENEDLIKVRFDNDFEKCYDFLNQTIKLKMKVLWEYD